MLERSDIAAVKEELCERLSKAIGSEINWIYLPQGNVNNQMIDELLNMDIPFVYIPNSPGYLIINEADQKTVEDINKNILETEQDYDLGMKQEQFRNGLNTLNDNQNKTLMALPHMSNDKAFFLKKKLNHVRPGFAFGIRKDSKNTFRLSFHTPSVLQGKDRNLCSAYLNFMLETENTNQITEALKKKDIQAEQVNNFIDDNKHPDETFYISSDNNPAEYYAIQPNGISKYNLEIQGGEYQNCLEDFIDEDSPEFEAKIQELQDAMQNKRIMFTSPELIDFQQNKTRLPKRGGKQVIKGEKKFRRAIDSLTKQINKMILGRESGTRSFSEYMNEAASILNAVINKQPVGYAQKDLDKIAQIISKAGLSVKDFANVGKMLEETAKTAVENITLSEDLALANKDAKYERDEMVLVGDKTAENKDRNSESRDDHRSEAFGNNSSDTGSNSSSAQNGSKEQEDLE